MINFLKSLWSDESGASAAEYALILAVIGAGISIAANTLSTAIDGALDTAALTISGASDGT